MKTLIILLGLAVGAAFAVESEEVVVGDEGAVAAQANGSDPANFSPGDPRTTIPCFSGDTLVSTPAGLKRMAQVDAGDQVYVVDEEGQVRLDTVYLQAHKVHHLTAEFYRIRTLAGRSLALSGQHYIYVDGAMVQGQEVQVGDQVSVLDPATQEMTTDQVREVSVIHQRGFYSPWTLSGHLLTSGVHSSAYSADTRPFSPAALHAIFWPLRQLTKMADITFQGTRLTEGQPAWMFLAEGVLQSMKN